MKLPFNKLIVSTLVIIAALLFLTSVAWARWSSSSYWQLLIVDDGDVCTDSIFTGLAMAKDRETKDSDYQFIFYDAETEGGDINDFPNTFDQMANFAIDLLDDSEDEPWPSECSNFDNVGFEMKYCGAGQYSWNVPEGTKLYLEILNGNDEPFDIDLTNSSPAEDQSGELYEFNVKNCSPPIPPVVTFTEIEPGSTDTLVTDALVFQAAAHVPTSEGDSTPNGTDVSNVELHIFDADTTEVHGRTENNRFYCAFGDDGLDTPCDRWVFADHNYEWPGGDLIRNGEHTLQTIAHGSNGTSTTEELDIIIQLPIAGNWLQIGQNATANVVTDALVGQVEAYLGAHVDGKDVARVVLTLIGPDGQPIRIQTENGQPYCLFGGSDPCPVWNFADNNYQWPNGNPIQHGTHTLRATIYADDPGGPDNRSETIEFEFDIQMPPIVTNLAQTGPGSINPVVMDTLVFQAEAYIGAANVDGTNIDNVVMRIIDPGGSEVHQSSDSVVKYCAFGGGQPNCNEWVFADHDYKWPGDDDIENGNHTLRLTVNTKDGRTETVDFAIEIDNPELEPTTNPIFLPLIMK